MEQETLSSHVNRLMEMPFGEVVTTLIGMLMFISDRVTTLSRQMDELVGEHVSTPKIEIVN